MEARRIAPMRRNRVIIEQRNRVADRSQRVAQIMPDRAQANALSFDVCAREPANGGKGRKRRGALNATCDGQPLAGTSAIFSPRRYPFGFVQNYGRQ